MRHGLHGLALRYAGADGGEAVSRPVDALAVMDRAAGSVNCAVYGSSEYQNETATEKLRSELLAARADVAELVEASGDVLYLIRDRNESKKRLIAALTKFGGAA